MLSGLAAAAPEGAAAAAPQWTVQVDPLTAALGFAHVQVERAIFDELSVYLGPHLKLYDGLLSSGHEPYRGYGAELGLRAFPLGGAPAGLWVEARGVLAGLHTTDGSQQRALGGYGSALGGYTGILAKHLVLAGGAGVQYIHYSVSGYGPVGVFPALHTAIGVAF